MRCVRAAVVFSGVCGGILASQSHLKSKFVSFAKEKPEYHVDLNAVKQRVDQGLNLQMGMIRAYEKNTECEYCQADYWEYLIQGVLVRQLIEHEMQTGKTDPNSISSIANNYGLQYAALVGLSPSVTVEGERITPQQLRSLKDEDELPKVSIKIVK
jgi:hypothetical protein